MTTAQDQQSRAEFEAAWMKKPGVTKPPQRFPNGGDYVYPAANTAWWAWQAARALPAGIEPVGYLIDWPDEPDLGHYFAEGASTTGRSQPLHTAAQVLAMGRVPPGWQAVPVEPTEEMKRGAQMAAMDHSDHGEWLTYEWQDVLRTWKGLLAAAPRPPAAQERKPGKNPHDFRPNKKYPWFCADCGYAPHDPLMHKQIKAAS